MPKPHERDLDEARPALTPNDAPKADSVFALAAIGVTAYVSCDLVHELLGHGGACMATGGRPITFSSFHFQCFGGWQPFVCSAGIFANIAVGLVLWLVLRRARLLSAHTRYFLWLAMAYNLFSAWGYIVTSTISSSGDWANALRGVPLAWQAKAGIALVAASLYILSIRITASAVRAFVGPGFPARVWRLIFVPYFAAALVAGTAAMLNGILTRREALNAAISTTLGSWGFLFLPLVLFVLRRRRKIVHDPSPAFVTYSWPWIVGAAILAVLFVAVVGPGVRPHS